MGHCSLSWDWDAGVLVSSPRCCPCPELHTIVHQKILIQIFGGLFGVEEVITHGKALRAEPGSL